MLVEYQKNKYFEDLKLSFTKENFFLEHILKIERST